MELSEAVQVIIDYFEGLGFMLDYEEDDDEGRWNLLFTPNDKDIIELAKKIKASTADNAEIS